MDFSNLFLSMHYSGGCTLGGKGDYSIPGKVQILGGSTYGGLTVKGPPEYLPEVLKNRSPIGRNSSCPCESGKKYKNCCGKAKYDYKSGKKPPILTLSGIPLDFGK